MNKIFLIGNLTKDPELSETNSGISVCRFTIAVNRRFQDANGQQQTDFFNITAWRGLAENVAKYCKKGGKVAVTGSIWLRSYEDRDGVRRLSVDVNAEEVEFLTPKGSFADRTERDASKPAKKPSLEAFDDDSDIPF